MLSRPPASLAPALAGGRPTVSSGSKEDRHEGTSIFQVLIVSRLVKFKSKAGSASGVERRC